MPSSPFWILRKQQHQSFDLKEDTSGVLYVVGFTESGGLPSTSNALQADYDGSVDAFALKLDPTKAGAAGINYFTYIGSPGLQIAYGVDLNSSGDMYLVGSTTTGLLGEFGGPERGTVDGTVNGFVMEFSTAASSASSTTAGISIPSTGLIRHPHLPILPHR